MSLDTAKKDVNEINGALCSIVESDISTERMQFLKDLLEYNGYEVKILEKPGTNGSEEKSYTIGVTDLLFTPVIKVYEKALKRPNGKIVTPAYWNQEEEIDHLPYFNYRERKPGVKNEDDFVTNPWSYRTV